MKPLIVALDVETEKEALRLTRLLSPWVDLFKVGPVLFLKGGGPFLPRRAQLGAHIFLDLKFHDIPSVVKRAVERAGEWDVYSATVHIAGGREMMQQAASSKKRPKLWGVTILTSLDGSDLQSYGVQRSLPEQITHLAAQASTAGLDGVIASGEDAKMIKQAVSPKFVVVTPGLRLNPSADDQKRSVTPWEARQNGADFLVVGRPIVEAQDPVQVVKSIYEKMDAPLASSASRKGGR